MGTIVSDTQTAAAPIAQLLPLSQLQESPWNPRQIFPEKEMAELESSMRESGFREWLPIVVRPVGDGNYEIGAGHRRSRAAAAAGIEHVPCIVKAMTDEEFLDVLNFDNSGREDVHPLHEAAGWKTWMEKTGNGVKDIAARIGQSIEYVYQRLKYSDLIPEARQAFMDEKISAAHAVVIARLQPPEQKKALKFCEPPDWDPMKHMPVRDLVRFLQSNIQLDLSDAAWDLDDATLLPEAGACRGCSKSSSKTQDEVLVEIGVMPAAALNSEEEDEEWKDESSAGKCEDPGCFYRKVNALKTRVTEALAAQGKPAPVAISSGYGKAKKGVLPRDRWTEAKEGDKGAKPAIVEDGPDIGKVMYVKVKAAASSASSAAGFRGGHDYEADRKRDEAARKREQEVRVQIVKEIQQKVSVLARADLEMLIADCLEAAAYGTAGIICQLAGVEMRSNESAEVALKRFVGAIGKLADVDLYRLVITALVANELDEWNCRAHGESPTSIMKLAKRYKVDAAAIRLECETIQAAAEGGTRREVEDPDAAETPADKKPAPAAKSTAKKKPAAAAKKKPKATSSKKSSKR